MVNYDLSFLIYLLAFCPFTYLSYLIFPFCYIQNFHVHGFVYADNWRSIADKMVEGGLYVITNFYTREAKGTLKPTSSNYLINFSNSTTVEKLLEDDFMIPYHKFEFVDLSELYKLASSYENVDSPEFSTGHYT